MKTLQETFVIVKTWEEDLENHVSFSREELETKCAELNAEINAKWRKEHKTKMAKKKKKTPHHEYQEMVVFSVMNMKEAVERLVANTVDYYQKTDESY